MYLGIILTLLTGLFFLIGILVLNNSRNKGKLALFTTALASVVMAGLLFTDLLPEIMEAKNNLLIIPAFIGFLVLVLLDKLIPHHHHVHTEKHCDKVEHEHHLNHIGTITILALAIHNMIEGLTLYSVTLNSFKSGLLMMISISLHNIPLGFQIGNSLENKKNSKLLIILLCLSSLVGALIMIAFGGFSEKIISILLALTFGMLLYIFLFELLNEIKKYLIKKETIYGIIIGVIVLIITYVL